MDMGKIKTELFIPSMLEATKKNTTLNGQVYGLPHIWGTDGLVVNTRLAKMTDYPDLCKPEYKGKVGISTLASSFLVGWYDWLEKNQGPDYLAKLKLQDPKIYVGSAPAGQTSSARPSQPYPSSECTAK
jgi:ABC-type Fe3+ transport system substrate-binding protein